MDTGLKLKWKEDRQHPHKGMRSMEETVTIMASVDSVWSSPGLTEVGVGGPVVQGTGLLQDGQISEFLFQDFLHQAAGRT